MAAKKTERLNNEITARRIRLIGADGEQAGVVSLTEGKELAAIA
ncbi:MAG: translation initiation factor IF-3, partial [Methylococcales bacterium]|nr:translation initiation factor IF-3 [Methylococcales bacterium]MBT7968049.1 translation initiation factor IF-3 [Methylococcales bacterium]